MKTRSITLSAAMILRAKRFLLKTSLLILLIPSPVFAWESFTGTISGTTLSWTTTGWMQVQRVTDVNNIETVCDSSVTPITSCDVGIPGRYHVLDHTNQLRWLSVMVPQSDEVPLVDESPEETPEVTVETNSDCTSDTEPCVLNNTLFSFSNSNIVFADEFESQADFENHWHHEMLLDDKTLHQKPGVSELRDRGYAIDENQIGSDIDGRRDASFYNDYPPRYSDEAVVFNVKDATSSITQLSSGNHDPQDGVLVQRGIRLRKSDSNNTYSDEVDAKRNKSYTDPRILDMYGDSKISTNGTNNINFGEHRLFTSFLSSFAFYNNDMRETRPLTTANGELIKFGPGSFFETEVSFEHMSMDGHRVSFWLMPAKLDEIDEVPGDIGPYDTDEATIKNVALNYDGRPVNGLEIDIFEREFYSRDDSTGDGDGPRKHNTLFMKAINGNRPGDAIDPYDSQCSNDSAIAAPYETQNELGNSTVYGSWNPLDASVDGRTAHVEIGVNFPTGPISTGYHKVGFYYGENSLIWFVDGYPVVVDSCLVPTTDMYIILSREMNTGVLPHNSDNTIFDPAPNSAGKKNEPVNPEILADGGLWGHLLTKEENLNKLGQVVLNPDNTINSDANQIVGDSAEDYVAFKYVRVWNLSDGIESEIPVESESSLNSNPIMVTGNVISWPNDGWYQVQTNDGATIVCEGGSSCTVTSGVYTVINIDTNTRYDNIVVGQPTLPEGITVTGNTISWPIGGSYAVQTNGGGKSICVGGNSCTVLPGVYLVINQISGERFPDIVVLGSGSSAESQIPSEEFGEQFFRSQSTELSRFVIENTNLLQVDNFSIDKLRSCTRNLSVNPIYSLDCGESGVNINSGEVKVLTIKFEQDARPSGDRANDCRKSLANGKSAGCYLVEATFASDDFFFRYEGESFTQYQQVYPARLYISDIVSDVYPRDLTTSERPRTKYPLGNLCMIDRIYERRSSVPPRIRTDLGSTEAICRGFLEKTSSILKETLASFND